MGGRADSCDGNLDEMTAMARQCAKAIQILTMFLGRDVAEEKLEFHRLSQFCACCMIVGEW
jgi:hypothetical protein